jgi:membrane protein
VEELKAIQPADSEATATQRPARSARPHPRAALHKRIHTLYVLLSRTMHRTVLSVLAHDCLNMAQSTAYSAIVALFPTLIVAAAVIGLLPDTTPLRFQLAVFFDRILPASVNTLLDAYFQNTPSNTHSVRALVGAGFVSYLGASNVMVTLMEGLRRARNLPPDCWTFWQRRRRGFELVFLSLVPLAVASLMVMFGHAVTVWVAPNISPDVRASVYVIAVIIRWSVSLGASVGLIALIYRLGVPGNFGVRRYLPRKQRSLSPAEASILTPQSWLPTLPGAIVATAMWFLTTLAFGWYVTRFANYSEVYGSLGAGIALLFWLYIISLSVLCGAEFNAQFHAHFNAPASPETRPAL